MSDPSWLAVAKTLQAGRRVRIQCCAADKSLMVSNEAKGYRAYCFRCGPAGFVAHGDFSIEQLKRRRMELEWQQTRTVALPKDFTTDIPPSEAVWLYKAGVSHSVSKHYGFGYSAELRRIILPIYKDGVLQGYTARSTINERPKYIERMVDPYAYFVSSPSICLPRPPDDPGPRYDIAITEDILSAVRVGRILGRSIALLGTSAGDRALVAQSDKAVLWLDPDRAGRGAARKLYRSLKLQGIDVTIIRSDKDPKYYSNREIRQFLS